jgi:hypothetical protein
MSCYTQISAWMYNFNSLLPYWYGLVFQMITDKQFLADLEKEYPNEDWDKMPNPDSFSDVYTVHGLQWDIRHFKGNTKQHKVGFSVNAEYATIEEAQAQVEKCKVWENVIPESIEIRAGKPQEIVHKFLIKELRQDILDGKNVFPMYLP